MRIINQNKGGNKNESTSREKGQGTLKKVARFISRALTGLVKTIIFLGFILSAIWCAGFFYVHLDRSLIIRLLVIALVTSLFIYALIEYLLKRRRQKWGRLTYGLFFIGLFAYFLSVPAKQDRDWKAEVRHPMSFTRSQKNPNLITIHTVRDFDWVRPADAKPFAHPKQPYFHSIAGEDNEELVGAERWTERTIDLSKLSGINIVNSYWMGEPVGHTLLSFDFSDDRPLAFSFEIRKEADESFSSIGGFFRKYEMILIAAEERDIIYTRSNVRGEQVYIFPIKDLKQQQVEALFLNYMQAGESLLEKADWYNTIIDNCTTVIFDLAHQVDSELQWDYRILLSGYVPEYLYDRDLLSYGKPDESTDTSDVISNSDVISDPDLTINIGKSITTQPTWDIDIWYDRAHINPKTAHFSHRENQASYEYSTLIRQGLPQPALITDIDAVVKHIKKR